MLFVCVGIGLVVLAFVVAAFALMSVVSPLVWLCLHWPGCVCVSRFVLYLRWLGCCCIVFVLLSVFVIVLWFLFEGWREGGTGGVGVGLGWWLGEVMTTCKMNNI